MAADRPSLAQDLAWRIEALAFDGVIALARLLPIDVMSDLGGALFKRLGPLTRNHHVAEQNLRLVFPQAPNDEIAGFLRDQWDNTGRTFVETLIMDRIMADPSRVEVVNGERLDEIAAGGAPVVFVSGHLSNWEVMPAVIAHSPVVCQITYRAANNPYVDHRIKASRRRYGVRLFAPKGGDGAREILEAMARGESVALMNDQKFNGGIAAPLFGHIAHTASGPTKFALRFGTVLQPMSVQRKQKARFRVVVHDPIHLDSTGDRNADLEAGVRKVNAFIEERIRERPAEWFWVHRRWPTEMYRRRR